jgi:hypothetical protein
MGAKCISINGSLATALIFKPELEKKQSERKQ